MKYSVVIAALLGYSNAITLNMGSRVEQLSQEQVGTAVELANMLTQ